MLEKERNSLEEQMNNAVEDKIGVQFAILFYCVSLVSLQSY